MTKITDGKQKEGARGYNCLLKQSITLWMEGLHWELALAYLLRTCLATLLFKKNVGEIFSINFLRKFPPFISFKKTKCSQTSDVQAYLSLQTVGPYVSLPFENRHVDHYITCSLKELVLVHLILLWGVYINWYDHIRPIAHK